MNRYGILEPSRVAAGQQHHDRHARAASCLEHHAVAPPQTLARERQAGLPEAVLQVPDVRAAIERGHVRIVEQTPAAPPRSRPARTGNEE